MSSKETNTTKENLESIEKQNLKQATKELDDFIGIINHINVVIDNFNNLSNTDENDLYDLIYAKKKIEQRLESAEVINKDIKSSLSDILNRIDIILNSLTKEDIKFIQTNKLKNTAKLDKTKYSNRNKLKGLKDFTQKVKGSIKIQDWLKEYAKNRCVQALVILSLPFILNLIQKIGLWMGTGVNTPSSYTTLMSLFSTIANILSSACIGVLFIGIGLDMMYAIFLSDKEVEPDSPLNELLEHYVSEIAIKINKELREDKQHEFKSVDTSSRVIVAETLIDNLIFDITKQIKVIQAYDVSSNIETKIKIDELTNLHNKLIGIKDKSLKETGLKRLEALASGELIYWNTRDTVKEDTNLNDLYNKLEKGE